LIASIGEYLGERSLELAERAIQYVRPIYGASAANGIDGLGSGVLIRRAAKRWVATANHVLNHNSDTPLEEGTSLYVGMPDGSINKNLVQTQLSGLNDPYDLALLPCDFLNDYPESMFLDADADLVDDRADFAFYHVIGYRAAPHAMDVHEGAKLVRPKPFLYTGTRVTQEESSAHLHLQIDAMKARHGNERWETGSLEGVSGGGVFPILPLAQNSPRVQLAGIFIEHPKARRRVIATKTSVLRALLQLQPS